MTRAWCIVGLMLALAWPGAVWSGEAAPAADDPQTEARMLRLASELRCLVCQNQTIADSHSGLAEDLRKQLRLQITRGDTDAQIIDYMTARYGDFVLYRPPVKATTVLLWFGPALLATGGLFGLVVMLRRRSRMSPALFDEDDAQAPDPQMPPAAEPRAS